jgi:arylsulfate sulfotransferase
VIVTSLALSGCAGGSGASGVRTLSPFVSLVQLGGFELPTVTAVQYTIAPKPGSVSKPVHVTYSLSALVARGYVVPDSITLPVFGPYAGYENQVAIEIKTNTGPPLSLQVSIATPDYVTHLGYTVIPVLLPRVRPAAIWASTSFSSNPVSVLR